MGRGSRHEDGEERAAKDEGEGEGEWGDEEGASGGSGADEDEDEGWKRRRTEENSRKIKNAAIWTAQHQSPQLSQLVQARHNTTADQLIAQLEEDIDADGHLTKPSRWGLGMKDKGEPSADPSKRINGKTMDEELQFWQDVANGQFHVPTDPRQSAVAGRWDRATRSDPDLKARYDSITGEKVQSRKNQFRRVWAEGEYDKVKDVREGNRGGGRRRRRRSR
eukprot:9502483-Pyramimonas_sp.AAC.1